MTHDEAFSIIRRHVEANTIHTNTGKVFDFSRQHTAEGLWFHHEAGGYVLMVGGKGWSVTDGYTLGVQSYTGDLERMHTEAQRIQGSRCHADDEEGA